jgi:hypothetical protein
MYIPLIVSLFQGYAYLKSPSGHILNHYSQAFAWWRILLPYRRLCYVAADLARQAWGMSALFLASRHNKGSPLAVYPFPVWIMTNKGQ